MITLLLVSRDTMGCSSRISSTSRCSGRLTAPWAGTGGTFFPSASNLIFCRDPRTLTPSLPHHHAPLSSCESTLYGVIWHFSWGCSILLGSSVPFMGACSAPLGTQNTSGDPALLLSGSSVSLEGLLNLLEGTQ